MWRNELPLLETMEVPRCFKLTGMNGLKKIELHHFSDASTEGHGQCSYLHLVDTSDKVNCSLVLGKARVTPLKPITIPRLELTAAVVSVRVSDMLRRELQYDELEEVFWTDSKVVQAYIQNDARRFHTFVANRVQQIREQTLPEQWHYVDRKTTPLTTLLVVSVPKTSCNLQDGYKDLPFCGNTVATGGTLIRVHPNPSS